MRVARLIFSAADVRRKVRALSALAENAGATEHERANAEALNPRLQPNGARRNASGNTLRHTQPELRRRLFWKRLEQRGEHLAAIAENAQGGDRLP